MMSFPLTREQEGLWVEWKLSARGISYNTCVQAKITGELDVERFRHATALMVDNFQLLRGYCVEEDGHPVMQMSDEPFTLDYVDVSEGAEEETEAARNKALAILNRKRDAAIDLTTFPLIRAGIIKVAADAYYFIGVVPHLISDGYSAVFVLHAISIAYNQGEQGLVDAFAEDKKDWSDYLALRAERDPEDHAKAMSYWQDVLADAQHITPICDADAEVIDTNGKRSYFAIEEDIAKRLRKLAFANRTSLFSVLAALYATFLYRYTSQDDMIIAFPVNLRPPGYRHAFGFYVNVVPLRVDVSGNPSFSELVKRIGQQRRQDKKHQHLPSLDIVKAKRQITQDFDGRLTNVSMGQTVSRFQGLDLEGCVCEALDNELIDVRDDLSLMYEVTETLIGLWLEYRESAFADDEIERMVSHMASIVTQVDANPDVALDSIELLDDQQRDVVLGLGKGPEVPPTFDTYPAYFQHAVASYSDQSAATFGERSLTYAQLDRAAAAFASKLNTQDRTIAIWLDRGLEQLVAMLGTWRSGCAYLPLDRSLPVARVQTILEDSDAQFLITDKAHAAGLDEQWRDKVVAIDIESLEFGGDSAPAAKLPSPSETAYLIYTSGSTGRPKGVRVSHGAVAQRMAWLRDAFPLESGEAVLGNTSYAFDVSVAELFWPLSMGGHLILADTKLAKDPRYLRTLVRDHHIAAACFVPSALSSLLSFGDASDLASLRLLLAAGEALPASLATSVHAATNASLYNVYGPTEATVYASCKKISALDERITIGHAIGNTQLMILNDAAQLQPIGVEGELCIGGVGLADGYEGQAELTEAKFIANPYGAGRLYRTGDRAKMLVNGEIEYLGRADQQVKLRGFRVELEDVAHTLTTLSGIDDAAVLASGEDRQQLIAFICGDVETNGLRDKLAELLPPYMLPNQFIAVPEIPRLASGKLNRGALPLPDQRRSQVDIVPPSTDQERAFAKVWAKVLDVPLKEIGIHSNFFELGGDSLLLIALACGAEEEGIFIEVHELFDHPTIATALTRARTESSVAADQSVVTGEYPALPRHRKLFDDGFAIPEHWNRCILVSFARHLDHAALESSFAAVVAHHDGLRLSFHEHDDGDVTFINHAIEDTDVSVDYLDVTGLEGDARTDRVYATLNDANASLDLNRVPLLRVVVIEDASSSTLALVSHHLLIDMRSAHILLEDLLTSYQSAVSNRPIRLPNKTTSLAVWSERLAQTVTPDWHLDELRYWQQQLRHAATPLPVDHDVEGFSLESDQITLEQCLNKAETQALTRRVAIAKSAGVNEMVLAAFAEAYAAWSGAPALVFNTTGVGRDKVFDDINLTRTVGELNTVYPVALNFEHDDMLANVQEALSHVPANGLHYGMLRYLAKHPELADAQEPQVFFNYVSRLDSALEKSLGARISMAPSPVHTSAPQNKACYQLYLEALIQDGELWLHLGYDTRRFTSATAEALMTSWLVNLRQHVGITETLDAAVSTGG